MEVWEYNHWVAYFMLQKDEQENKPKNNKDKKWQHITEKKE